MADNISVKFNQRYFDEIMKESGISNLVKQKAEKATSIARESAPVDTGAYRDSIHVEEADFKYRTGFHVVADDKKALLVESKTGNLARALKRVKS